MSATVTTAIEAIEVQLKNHIVTTPATVYFEKDGVGVEFDGLEGRYLEITFALQGSRLVMVTRDYHNLPGEKLQVQVLHDWSEAEATESKEH